MGLIKKYETGELIGKGSMGSVYRARDIVLERDVALKVIHSRGGLDPELRERFYREARAGAALRHPNVVVVYELDEHNGVPFMAMELLSGSDLRRYISEHRPMTLAQKVEIFAQICDGLEEAHRQGIVHRDIKPSNIFIHEEGTAKILDFGIARVSSSKLTVAGKVLGTPNYMAPEQINRRQCDSRSDLFSAAIVFFEFLVYSHPFQSSFIPRRIVDDDPDTLSDRDPLIPQSLVDLLYRALQKRPEDRVQTAAGFAAGLRGVLRELRTGLAAEPFAPLDVPMAPADPTPATAGNPDSPDGRLARFVQLLSDFEAALEVRDETTAEAVAEDMARLEAADNRFTDALRECQGKLKQVHAASQPAALSAVAAAGSIAAPVRDGIVESDAPGDLQSDSRGGREPWDPNQSIFDDRLGGADGDVGGPWSAESEDALTRICGSCHARNRHQASHCQDCGRPLTEPSEAKRRQPQAPYGSIPESARTVANTALTHIRELWSQVLLASKQGWAWFLKLPRNVQYAACGVLSIVLIVVIVAATLSALKPIPMEQHLGKAVVQAAEAPLLDSESGPSRRLAVLARGTQVNVLNHVVGPGQQWVRVQVVTPKVRRPGYVALAHLGELTSSKPAVAWEYLALSRPPADNLEANRAFIQNLMAFTDRFPGTVEARLATLDRAAIHVKFAEQAKASGKDRAEWQGDLDQARRAVEVLGIGDGSPDHEKQILARLLELSRQEVAEEPAVVAAAEKPKDMVVASELARLYRRALAAWHGADLTGCEDAALRMLDLDPENKSGKRFLAQVEQARASLLK